MEGLLTPSSIGNRRGKKSGSTCSWCDQTISSNEVIQQQQQQQGQGSPEIFCSDQCFSQCRRAAFKRVKICDWCKHVRHTVTYVDFNDGQRQLQFCTDKCLNQYKMHLFCSEAISLGVIHNPSTPINDTNRRSRTASNRSCQQLLITPELWKTNCNRPSIGHHDNPPIDGALNLVKRVKLGHVVDGTIHKGQVDNTGSKKGKSLRPRTHVVDQLEAFQFPANFPIWQQPRHVITPSTNQMPVKADLLPTTDLTSKSDPQSTSRNLDSGEGPVLNDPPIVNENKTHMFPVLPPNFVMTPYPILIPLPIPVPIPIPINIHEHFLKDFLS